MAIASMPLRSLAQFSAILLIAFASARSSEVPRRESPLAMDSSDKALVRAFQWASQQALAYARDRGDPVGPWYEAALPGREAFCMRDVAHQAMGAHALGLAAHTANMLRQFAEGISDSRDWCSFWEIDRYKRPAPVDYKSDAEFWYCLPANYDVLDACYRMFLWTGDEAYVKDPVFVNFYDRTVTDYEARWSLDAARIMKRKRWMNVRGELELRNPFQFYRGNPTYQERREDFTLGVDLLATQYAAYLAYAGIEDVRRQDRVSQQYLDRAATVKRLLNNEWWDESQKQFYSRLNAKGELEGHESSALLYRNAVEPGPKLQSARAAMTAQIEKTPSAGVEGESHNPEILYRYGVPDLAYSQILDLTRDDRERREYPEVSFSVVGAIVTGLMGITVDPRSYTFSNHGDFVDRAIRTLPELGRVEWAEIRNLRVRANELAVRHEGQGRTLFTNQSGPSLVWRAAFAGSFSNLKVNGKSKPAHTINGPSGAEISFVDVFVAPGVTARVEVPK